jgi:hypothetical protein
LSEELGDRSPATGLSSLGQQVREQKRKSGDAGDADDEFEQNLNMNRF